MAVPAQVTWANTSTKPGTDIRQLGGYVKRFFGRAPWQLRPEDAIASIEHDEWRFYVELDGEKVWLEVEEDPQGQKKLSLSGEVLAEEVFGSLPDKPTQ